MIRDDAPSTDQLPMLDYAYTHEETQATTGYFSCVPPSACKGEALGVPTPANRLLQTLVKIFETR